MNSLGGVKITSIFFFPLRFSGQFLLLSCALLLSACETVPLQEVRPFPVFITMAVEPGDDVELLTFAGERFEFRVDHVDDESISSPGRRFLLSEIDELYVISELRPEYPCDQQKEFGCTIPAKVKTTDRLIDLTVQSSSSWGGILSFFTGLSYKFTPVFYFDCVQHDFCYRHGYATYGHDKQHCDREFCERLKDTCTSLQDGIKPQCSTAAAEFCWGVTEHAIEGAYQVETSTYCEYDGPVPNAAMDESTLGMR